MTPTPLRRRRLAVALALALTLGSVGQALGATVTATGGAQTLTVNQTTTIDGVPPTIAFPSANAGARSFAPAFTLTASTNGLNGLKVLYNQLDWTSGANTLPTLNNANLRLTSVSGPCPLASGTLAQYTASPGVAANGSRTLCGATAQTGVGAGTTTFTGIVLSIAVPTAQAAGDYISTITFSATEW